MTKRALLAAFLMPVLCSAQKFGTKAEPVGGAAATAASPGVMPFVQLLFALGIVFVLVKYALPRFLIKATQKGFGSSAGIKLEESMPIPGGALHVINARGKSLLIATHSTGVSLISELGSTTQEPIFLDVLAAEAERPEPPIFAMANESEPDRDKIEDALRRLERLSR